MNNIEQEPQLGGDYTESEEGQAREENKNNETKEKLMEQSEEFVDKNEPKVNNYIDQLLSAGDIESFNKIKKVIKSGRDFEDLPGSFLRNNRVNEVYEHYTDLVSDQLLRTKTEDDFNEIVDKLSKRDDFAKIDTIFRANSRSKEVFGHMEKLAQLSLGKLIDKCKKVPDFQDLEIIPDKSVRARGMFFEVVVPENYNFVIKRLYRNEGDDRGFKESKEYSLKANQLNREFYGDFLPEEKIIETDDGQLYVKAEKIADKKKEYLDLELLKEENQKNINKLLEDDKFVSDLRIFLESTKKFYESTKKDKKKGFLPDIAGKNLKIVYDEKGNYKRLVYLDTMGYLDQKHCEGSFNMTEKLLKLLDEKLEIINVRQWLGNN